MATKIISNISFDNLVGARFCLEKNLLESFIINDFMDEQLIHDTRHQNLRGELLNNTTKKFGSEFDLIINQIWFKTLFNENKI